MLQRTRVGLGRHAHLPVGCAAARVEAWWGDTWIALCIATRRIADVCHWDTGKEQQEPVDLHVVRRE